MRALLAAASFPLLLPRLDACTCVNPATPCHAAGAAAAAFTGTVLEVTEHPARPVAIDTGERAGNRPAAARRAGGPMPRPLGSFRAVRIQVGEVLSGVPAGQREIEIVTGLGGGDCGYPFQPGLEYVVYAYRDAAGRLATGICSGTRPAAQAAEHIAYFRALADAAASGEIRVRTGLAGVPPLAGAWIVAEGNGTRYTAHTDTAGVAVFTGLPAGGYTIHAASDGDLPDDPTVRLGDRGCQEVTLFRPLRIVGRVMTRTGLPAAAVEVQYLPIAPSRATGVMTSPDGTYELRIVAPGRYHLGINLDQAPTRGTPYPRWFHPGTAEPAAATVIDFAGRPEVRRYDLTLPDPQPRREMTGIVVSSDGRPVPRTRVAVLDPGSRMILEMALTDEHGRFLLQVFADTPYQVHAVSLGGTPDQARSAVPADVPPGRDPLDLRLVLTEAGNSLAAPRLR